MWSTPSSIAVRSTARAAAGSRGGPKTPGPASCIAPKPMRLIGLSPRNVVVFISRGSAGREYFRLARRSRPDLSEFEQFEPECLDLPDDAEHRRPIFKRSSQLGLAVFQLTHHRGEGRQRGCPE